MLSSYSQQTLQNEFCISCNTDDQIVVMRYVERKFINDQISGFCVISNVSNYNILRTDMDFIPLLIH